MGMPAPPPGASGAELQFVVTGSLDLASNARVTGCLAACLRVETSSFASTAADVVE
jgi:hypothetical protein